MFSGDGLHLIHAYLLGRLGAGEHENHRQQGCCGTPAHDTVHQYEVCCIKTYQDYHQGFSRPAPAFSSTKALSAPARTARSARPFADRTRLTASTTNPANAMANGPASHRRVRSSSRAIDGSAEWRARAASTMAAAALSGGASPSCARPCAAGEGRGCHHGLDAHVATSHAASVGDAPPVYARRARCCESFGGLPRARLLGTRPEQRGPWTVHDVVRQRACVGHAGAHERRVRRGGHTDRPLTLAAAAACRSTVAIRGRPVAVPRIACNCFIVHTRGRPEAWPTLR